MTSKDWHGEKRGSTSTASTLFGMTDTFQPCNASNVRIRDRPSKEARQLVDGQDGELWESDHLIARFPDPKRTTE
jgi:hypothetical protein